MDKFILLEGKYKCIFCSTLISNKRSINLHLDSKIHKIIESKSFFCNICKFVTKSQKTYESHLNTKTHNKNLNKNQSNTDTIINYNDNNNINLSHFKNILEQIVVKIDNIEKYNTDTVEVIKLIQDKLKSSNLVKT